MAFYKNQFAKPEALLMHIGSAEARKLADVKLRPDQKISFLREGLNQDLRIKFCFAVVKQLQGI